MKETETYYQVCLTRRLAEGVDAPQLKNIKFPTLDGAKGYAQGLLGLVPDDEEPYYSKTGSRYELYAEDFATGMLRLVCFAEVVDQDGNVQQI